MKCSKNLLHLHFVFIMLSAIMASYTFKYPDTHFEQIEFDDSYIHDLSDHNVSLLRHNGIKIEPPRTSERILLEDTIRFTAYPGPSRRLRIEIIDDTFRSHVDYYNYSCHSIKRRPIKVIEQKLVINKTKLEKENVLIGYIYCKAELSRKYLMEKEYLIFEGQIAKQLYNLDKNKRSNSI